MSGLKLSIENKVTNVIYENNSARLEINKSKPIILNVSNVGSKGLSEYEIAVRNGFVGSESEWLESRLGVLPPELEDRIRCLEENDGIVDGMDFLAHYILKRDN